MLSFFLYVQLFLFIQRDDSNSLSALEIPSRNRLDHFQNCCCAAALVLETSGAGESQNSPHCCQGLSEGGATGSTRGHESRLSHAHVCALPLDSHRLRVSHEHAQFDTSDLTTYLIPACFPFPELCCAG